MEVASARSTNVSEPDQCPSVHPWFNGGFQEGSRSGICCGSRGKRSRDDGGFSRSGGITSPIAGLSPTGAGLVPENGGIDPAGEGSFPGSAGIVFSGAGVFPTMSEADQDSGTKR